MYITYTSLFSFRFSFLLFPPVFLFFSIFTTAGYLKHAFFSRDDCSTAPKKKRKKQRDACLADISRRFSSRVLDNTHRALLNNRITTLPIPQDRNPCVLSPSRRENKSRYERDEHSNRSLRSSPIPKNRNYAQTTFRRDSTTRAHVTITGKR